jgi:hypothetical protein
MEPTILNSDFENIGILDKFESLIWTDRYCGYGDFEVTTSANTNFIKNLVDGKYLILKESDHTMVLETINIAAGVDNASRIIVKGRSLESILDRRIIWDPVVMNGPFQDIVQLLLDISVMNPLISARKFVRFEFEASTDPAITSLTADCQYNGDSLYKVITELCISKNLGYIVSLTDSGKFRFKLYSGINRSYSQFANPYVVFSPGFENLVNSDYIEDSTLFKTVALVSGEAGVANKRTTVTAEVISGASTDLDRRELFVDAAGITRRTPGGATLSEPDYLALLKQKGIEELTKNIFVQSFSGQADTTVMYAYGIDFGMGDVVQVANEYGNEAESRVIELIHSQDASGTKIYPTFSTD